VVGLVQGQQVFAELGGGEFADLEVSAPPIAAAFQTALAAGVFDQDAAHGLGGGEEVPPAVPVWFFLRADQP
jgi:hypothetical protein